jgi:8-oxo-dGTP pyrophosphatase MutT (NUDIX family)
MTRPWPLVASEPLFDAGLFRVTKDRACSPRTGGERNFYLLHMVDWLMAVPLTVDGKLVMVRQYRHGSRAASLEVPGGLHDGAGERPEQGAARELAEETGYCGGELSLLGELWPQPALMSNRVQIYLAKGVRKMAEARPDAGEDIEVVLLERREVPERIAGGEINNAMTVAALALANFGGHL